MAKRKKQTKKQKKKITIAQLIFILAIAALLAITATQLIYHFYKYKGVKQIQVYEMNLQVAGYIAFNLENQSLNFGTVIPGGSSTRFVQLSTEEPLRVEIIFKGKLSPWVSVSENNFVFEGNETLTFVAVAPENARFGNYTGKAILLFRKV